MRRAVIGIVLLSLFVLSSCSPVAAANAPDFCLKNLAGRTYCLKEFAGDVRVVVFWASWCENCKPLMTFMNGMFQEDWQRGLTVLGVNADKAEGRSHTKSVVIELKLRYPQLLDPAQSVLKTYNPKMTLPYLVVVDRFGKVRYRKAGYDSSMEKDLKKLIQKLLSERAP